MYRSLVTAAVLVLLVALHPTTAQQADGALAQLPPQCAGGNYAYSTAFMGPQKTIQAGEWRAPSDSFSPPADPTNQMNYHAGCLSPVLSLNLQPTIHDSVVVYFLLAQPASSIVMLLMNMPSCSAAKRACLQVDRHN